MSSRTIRELLKDPVFKKQFVSPPRILPNLSHGTPFRVWAQSHTGKWSKADTPDYATAFGIVKRGLAKMVVLSEGTPLEAEGYAYKDFSIVSMRQFFAPRVGIAWSIDEAWCSRCRRPVVYGYFARHHACANSPMRDQLDTDPRCPYCGIRREAMKEYTSGG